MRLRDNFKQGVSREYKNGYCTCKSKDSNVADEPRQKRIEREVSNEDHINKLQTKRKGDFENGKL